MYVDLDELYFPWLYGQMNPTKQKNPARNYWRIFGTMYKTPFTWTVANDDNRAGDGQDLRRECLEENGIDVDSVDQDWLNMDCSCLEMLIALARRAAFLASEDPVSWFWEMMENINLRRFNDMTQPGDIVEVVLFQIIWRTYDEDGKGGLFPCPGTKQNMTKVELWYQLQMYIEQTRPML